MRYMPRCTDADSQHSFGTRIHVHPCPRIVFALCINTSNLHLARRILDPDERCAKDQAPDQDLKVLCFKHDLIDTQVREPYSQHQHT